MKKLFVILFLSFIPTIYGVSENSKRESFKKKVNEFLKNYENSTVSIDNPRVVNGQLAGYATGGGITVKNEVVNRRLLTVTPPSYSAGCGGIDLQLGGFSYIEKDEVVNALKKIATASAAYAFILAMKSVSPQGEGAAWDLNDLQTLYNQMNLNSCEIARGLVSSAWPTDTAAKEHICEIVGSENGLFETFASSKHKCSEMREIKKNQKDLNQKMGDALYPPFNLTWEVIKKDPFISTHPEFAELAMSLVGTLIIDSNNIPHWYPSKAEDPTFISALMFGGESKGYKCKASLGKIEDVFKSSNDCLELLEDGMFNISEEQSWYETVNDTLLGIHHKILSDTLLDQNEKALIEKTDLPILRTITAVTVYHPGCAPTDISRLSKIIAMDILCQFINDVIVTIRSTSHSLENVQLNDSYIKKFLSNLDRVQNEVRRYRKGCQNLFQEYVAHEKFLEMIEGNIQRNIGL